MKTDLKTLYDSFKISYDTYKDSREEADEVLNFYHNRQYTSSQLSTLALRGQPAETFNVIKMFGRLILGYYSTVVNSVKCLPTQISDIPTTAVLNDVVNKIMETSEMETEGDKIKLDGLLQGIMVSYQEVVPTGQKDEFGRLIYEVRISHVPAEEIAMDPLSRLEDYEDGRFLHRWKWVSKEYLLRMFKDKKKEIEKLDPYYNHLEVDQSEFSFAYGDQFVGKFQIFDNFLLVHTVIEDDDGRRWSIYWSGETEFSRKEITFNEVRFPYRVHKIHTSNKAEYYGIFREVMESQKAINQALLKIQLMVNTQKAFVEQGAVEDLSKFTNSFNRVNAVIPVKKLSGIKIENLSAEVRDQYEIIDRALTRIQRVLGVNDSFLGMAYASDSGRKVKLQQNATTLALRYVSTRIEQYYRLLGWDVVNLVKQYYKASQVMRIADDVVGQRWIQLNQPMLMPTGNVGPDGSPEMDYVWEETLDPESGEPVKDENGRYVIAPVPEADTEIAFTRADISIDSVAYNDEDEKNQLMLETILSGNIGSVLMQVNPAGFFKAASMTVRSMKTKYSLDIGDILEQTGMLVGQGGMPMPQMDASQQPGSQTMKLPQNTNEGA